MNALQCVLRTASDSKIPSWLSSGDKLRLIGTINESSTEDEVYNAIRGLVGDDSLSYEDDPDFNKLKEKYNEKNGNVPNVTEPDQQEQAGEQDQTEDQTGEQDQTEEQTGGLRDKLDEKDLNLVHRMMNDEVVGYCSQFTADQQALECNFKILVNIRLELNNQDPIQINKPLDAFYEAYEHTKSTRLSIEKIKSIIRSKATNIQNNKITMDRSSITSQFGSILQLDTDSMKPDEIKEKYLEVAGGIQLDSYDEQIKNATIEFINKKFPGTPTRKALENFGLKLAKLIEQLLEDKKEKLDDLHEKQVKLTKAVNRIKGKIAENGYEFIGTEMQDDRIEVKTNAFSILFTMGKRLIGDTKISYKIHDSDYKLFNEPRFKKIIANDVKKIIKFVGSTVS